MNLKSSTGLHAILAFNRAVLGQALAVLDSYAQHPEVAFGTIAGPHLRHVIEHYEALLQATPAHVIHYDARQRDPELEQHVEVARERIARLLERLALWTAPAETPLTTVLRCGLDGGVEIGTASSVGRELMFVACHAIHHYALIHGAAVAAGLPLPVGFGKAPSTVHHEAIRALKAAA